MRRALGSLLPGGGRLAPVGGDGRPRSPRWRVPVQRLLDGALSGVAASCAACLATGPVVWARFGEWAPPGILATPLALPWVAAFLGVGWLWTLAPALVPQGLLALPAHGLVALLEGVDTLPGTPLSLPPRPLALILMGCGAALAAARRHRYESSPLLGRVAALALGLAHLPWALAPRDLEVVALDVGAGTAVLLRAPGGGAWLFDAGSRDRPGVATRGVAPLLRRWEVGRLVVVVSHGDRDHVSALPWLLERWSPDQVVGAAPTRPPEPTGRGVERWAHGAERWAHTGARIDLDRGRLVLPTRGPWGATLLRGRPGEGNEGSRSLEARVPGARVLLCGDAGEQGLEDLLDQMGVTGGSPEPPEPLELLLLPHHGSSSAHLGRLLDALRPRRVWVSCRGTPPVAAELERRGLPWEATGEGGALVWTARGPAVRVP